MTMGSRSRLCRLCRLCRRCHRLTPHPRYQHQLLQQPTFTVLPLRAPVKQRNLSPRMRSCPRMRPLSSPPRLVKRHLELTPVEMVRLPRNSCGTESGGARLPVGPHLGNAKLTRPRAGASRPASASILALPRGADTAVLNTPTFAPVQEDMRISVRSIDPWTLMPDCTDHACRERLRHVAPRNTVHAVLSMKSERRDGQAVIPLLRPHRVLASSHLRLSKRTRASLVHFQALLPGSRSTSQRRLIQRTFFLSKNQWNHRQLLALTSWILMRGTQALSHVSSAHMKGAFASSAGSPCSRTAEVCLLI